MTDVVHQRRKWPFLAGMLAVMILGGTVGAVRGQTVAPGLPPLDCEPDELVGTLINEYVPGGKLPATPDDAVAGFMSVQYPGFDVSDFEKAPQDTTRVDYSLAEDDATRAVVITTKLDGGWAVDAFVACNSVLETATGGERP